MLRVVTFNKGKPSIIDKNNYKYVTNGGSSTTNYWRCSIRKCKATIVSSKSSERLIGTLPEHGHTVKILKTAAEETENNAIKKYAACHGSKPAQVLAEISTNMLASNLPEQIHYASSNNSL